MGTYHVILAFPNGATPYFEEVGSCFFVDKRQTRGTETSKYPEEQKITYDSPSSGERTGRSPNRVGYGQRGVVGPQDLIV